MPTLEPLLTPLIGVSRLKHKFRCGKNSTDLAKKMLSDAQGRDSFYLKSVGSEVVDVKIQRARGINFISGALICPDIQTEQLVFDILNTGSVDDYIAGIEALIEDKSGKPLQDSGQSMEPTQNRIVNYSAVNDGACS